VRLRFHYLQIIQMTVKMLIDDSELSILDKSFAQGRNQDFAGGGIKNGENVTSF